jgi:hypothetical protein
MRCKWFETCPMVKFNEQGQLSDSYVSRFCHDNFQQCCHYKDSGNENFLDGFMPASTKSEENQDSKV